MLFSKLLYHIIRESYSHKANFLKKSPVKHKY